MAKNLPANAGDARDKVESLVWDDPLEEDRATHSSHLAWRIPMDRGVLQATVHGVTKSWIQLSTQAHTQGLNL